VAPTTERVPTLRPAPRAAAPSWSSIALPTAVVQPIVDLPGPPNRGDRVSDTLVVALAREGAALAAAASSSDVPAPGMPPPTEYTAAEPTRPGRVDGDERTASIAAASVPTHPPLAPPIAREVADEDRPSSTRQPEPAVRAPEAESYQPLLPESTASPVGRPAAKRRAGDLFPAGPTLSIGTIEVNLVPAPQPASAPARAAATPAPAPRRAPANPIRSAARRTFAGF
jgi:hypothetical protein